MFSSIVKRCVNKFVHYFSYFLDIISDLFPGLIEKPVDYGILEAGICSSIKQMGLENVDGEFSFLLIIHIKLL